MTRNTALPGGVSRFSRTSVYKMRGLYKKQAPKAKPAAAAAKTTKEVVIGGAKNGGKRVVPTKHADKYYPAEKIPKALPNRKAAGVSKTRASITPGTVLVLVSGPFRGKRVVYLKTLASGLLLVTGPYALNGVPLRRVNQTYVVATSTKVDISGVKVDAKFTDDYFRAAKKASKANGEFFQGKDEAKKSVAPERKADQAAVDKAILEAVNKVANLKGYLSSLFTLSKGQYPHELKF